MQKIIWSACFVTAILLGSSTQASTSQTASPRLAPSTLPAQQLTGVMDDRTEQVHPVDPKLEARPVLSLIASVPGFADWQAAEVKPVRNLHDREARTNAVLWEVQAGSQMIGYLVTSPDGQHLYEFSTRPVPELPPHLQAQAAANGYLYGGPALQLAYVNGEQGAELVNLLTGEMLPDGELLDRVPDTVPVAQKTAGSPRVLPLPTTAHAQDDAFYATGLYGKAQLGDADTGVQPLQEFAKQADYRQPTMIVYDAIPDKLYITLSLSKAIHLGADTTFLAVHDPFALNAEQSQPIYIDSRFPVTAVPVRL